MPDISVDIAITVLQQFFTLMRASSGPRAVFASVADSAFTMLEADAVAILEYDDVNEQFNVATARSLSLEAQVQTMRVFNDRARQNEAWFTRLQMVHNWAEQIVDSPEALTQDANATRAMISVPLRRSDEQDLLGVLVVFFDDAAQMTGRRQILATLLGSLATITLENARLYEAERHRADFLNEMLHVGETLQIDQSLDSILQQVVQTICDTLGWRTVLIILYDFEHKVQHKAIWSSEDPLFNESMAQSTADSDSEGGKLSFDDPLPWQRPEFKVSRSYYGEHGKPGTLEAVQLMEQNQGFKRSRAEETANYNDTSPRPRQWHPDDFLVVPLRYKDRELGWIWVDSPRDNRRPSLAHIQEIEVLADRVAQAVTSSRLYDEVVRERQVLSTILDGITDGVLAFDTSDHILFYNRAAERLLGVDFGSQLDAPMDVILAGSPLLAFLRPDPSDTLQTDELYVRDLNRTLFVNLSMLPDGGRLILMQDITYFRDMEQLRLELLASLSHDLKNPLAAIGLTASLVERSGPLNDRQKTYVNRLRSASRRAIQMISDLLGMARLEAGERIEEESVSITGLIDEVLEDMMMQIEQKNIILTYNPHTVPDVLGDRARLRQVVANLIGNAVKYTKAENGIVQVEVGMDDGQIRVNVTDNGAGIPAEHQPRIFDRFYRINPTLSDEMDGTGLGLAIVKTVVERHQGRVWVESEVGKGSTFSFVLPLAAVAE